MHGGKKGGKSYEGTVIKDVFLEEESLNVKTEFY